MKTYNHTLNSKNLEELLDVEYLLTQKHILIQIFCGSSKDTLRNITQELASLLPHAITIGTTTDGEIKESKIYTKESVISVSVFEDTFIKSSHVRHKDSFANGVELATNLITPNTKLLIIFTDGTTTNGEEFLKGVESVNNSIILAGGMAGDNGCFVQTFISEGSTILQEGAVGISLNSDNLYIHNDYSFNWDPIGVEHEIDNVQANRVYSIDGNTTVNFYAKYLGQEVADKLPATGIEFPLIMEKNGINIARAVIAKHDDGSLSFAGNLSKGDKVRLGFGDAEMIINNPSNSLEKFSNTHIESFFLYSCMARRRYMPEFIQIEVEPFANLAPTAGFFTYGEFYHHNNSNELLNQTLTVVALSESQDKDSSNSNKDTVTRKDFSEYATTIKALTNLIQQSVKDLEDQAQRLDAQKQFSQKLLDQQKLFLRHAVHETATPLAVIMSNIELYELEYSKNEYLSNIEIAMKNVFNTYDDLAFLVKKNQVEYPLQDIDVVDYLRSRIDFFKPLALGANLDIVFNAKIYTAMIKFNETKLQRIIDNNLTNAIKYTKEHEIINIYIDKTTDGYIINMSSKSTHIQHPEKIFEAYYREGYASDGFGLGLNLVKQICDEEDIKIEVISNTDITSFSYLFKGGSR